MSETTLWIATVFSVASAAVFAYVGGRVAQRELSEATRLAGDLFAVWWFALAGTRLLAAAATGAAAYGHLAIEYFVAHTYLNLFLACLGLWALLYYLLFLYTGRRGLLAPLTLAYIVYYLGLVYFVVSHDPSGVAVGPWSVRLDYRVEPGGPVVAVTLLLLVLPQILAALAYFLLFWRVDGRSRRYRIALVSWSIIAWFGIVLTGALLRLADSLPWWPLATNVVALVAALIVLAAYRPPRWVRERFGVRPSPAAPRGGQHA